ncbi:MAG: OmpA family protein [Brucellaceae bacterium]|jgi:outer membrane protein OmpA-like peptidoglycan-associated protein|nr:OmpA family protein [Brucellaceae bacterium]
MSIRSKLLATVVFPAFSASIMLQPVQAETLDAPIILAQDSGEQSPDDQALRQQQAEEMQRAAEEEARRQVEEQRRAAEEEARRQAAEQQRAAQEAAERQAAEQQRAVEEQRKAEQQRAMEEARRKEAEEAARQAAQQQKQAEEEARRAAEQQQKAAQEEANRQAAEQQRAAEEQRKAEQQRAAEEEARRKEADEAARQAEAQKQAAEQEQRDAAEQQKAVEQQKANDAAAEKPVKEPAEQAKPKETSEQPVEPAKPAEEPAAPVEPKPAEEVKEQPVPQVQPEQPAPQPAAPDEKPQNEVTAPVKQPDQPLQPSQPQAEQEAQKPADNQVPEPKAEIVDERTTAQKQENAKNPANTDETIVLPVENGAAILDSDKDADNSGGNQSREERRKQREEQRVADEKKTPPPANDAAAQVEIPAEVKEALPQKIEANLKEEGTRVKEAPAFVVPETTNIVNNTVINNTVINNTTVNNVTNVTNVTNVKVIEQVDNRIILETGDRIFVRGDDRPRLRRDAERTYYDELPRGRLRETIVRPGGYEIVTIYDRYGDILQRSRIDRNGNEYLMIYAPEYDDTPRAAIFDVGYDLPPMRLTIPVRDYIVDVARDPERDFYNFLSQPPVERVERIYSIDEVRHSARLRDKVRRIDLDTIHFATGSAEVSLSQAKTLRKVASAMQKILAKDPGETFFIEGHTDAVGSDRSNLVLSDRRAESVASLLTEVYDIPAENLVTQGYGERFLKIRTQAAEQENRRVTIRRVTPLIRPVAKR